MSKGLIMSEQMEYRGGIKKLKKKLTEEQPDIPWQVQELKEEGLGIFSQILHTGTHLRKLLRQLERLTYRVERCG